MSAPQQNKVVHLPKVRMLARGGRLASGIRITNVKSIRPPNPETVKKIEEDKIRAQVQKEIASRARTCSYQGYDCWLPVITGRRYCTEHILSDPAAPYVQCSHTYNNGERCPNPAPKPQEQRDSRDQGLCFEHARAALAARQRSAAPPPPVASTETLLNQLQHYAKGMRVRTTSCASTVSVVSDPAEPDVSETLPIDPFKQMDGSAINAAYSAALVEYASASDSDGDGAALGPAAPRPAAYADDVEDAPAEETPLWRAGVFTVEEAISETKSTLCALQSAYVRQMGRLRVLLQTARLQYLKALKQEKEQYSNIHSQAASGPMSIKERKQLRKLKAFASYHRKHGVDAVLARKLYHKRLKASEGGVGRGAGGGAGRCSWSEGGVRCAGGALPAAKHCLKHVLADPQQVLFRACGDLRGAAPCGEAAAAAGAALPPACRYHTDPPAYTCFALKKDGSDSDTETETVGSVTEDMEASGEHLPYNDGSYT